MLFIKVSYNEKVLNDNSFPMDIKSHYTQKTYKVNCHIDMLNIILVEWMNIGIQEYL
jgi:hypothetical protein